MTIFIKKFPGIVMSALQHSLPLQGVLLTAQQPASSHHICRLK